MLRENEESLSALIPFFLMEPGQECNGDAIFNRIFISR